jgi:hypothetical protein
MIVKDLLVLTQAVNEGVVNLLGTCRSIIHLSARTKEMLTGNVVLTFILAGHM